jgi:prolyl oligopeptidase
MLHGYGGFKSSKLPAFRVDHLVFIQHFGGILAIPNIRGGG